ncbi:MAG: hypothetical protein ACJ75H_17040 [Thermoanaerobaculia bacterium]
MADGAEASGVRALRVLVFVIGLGEFLTSILLLFFYNEYKRIFGLPPGFDNYYIQQIGMFQFLVGSSILIGSRQVENPLVSRFALYFNIVSIAFWIYFLASGMQQGELFHDTVIGFLVYHTIMTVALIVLRRRAGVA